MPCAASGGASATTAPKSCGWDNAAPAPRTHHAGEGPREGKAKQVLEAAFAAVADAIARGEEVSIQGFGKFKAAGRPAREGRNPPTGEALQIAASRKAAFAPAKPLKDKLNG